MSTPKNIFKKGLVTKLTVFLLALVILIGTFFFGYDYGQKGKAVFGLMAKNVANTEVGKPTDVDFSLYWQAWNKLKSDSIFATDTKSMINSSISGLLSSVNDPYTVFFTPEDNKRFQEDIQGEFDGIGVELIMKNDLPTVVAPLSDLPASKAGIKAGDVIIGVDGTDSSVLGFNELINKIRGKKGTTVSLTISRAGADEPLVFSVVRDTITVKSVTWEEKNQANKKIMYVKVRQFGDDTDQLFADFVASVSQAKPDGIVVDLRDDPGGYFETALNLASYFVDGGTVVKQQDKSGQVQDFSTTKSAQLKNYKTVVLVNGGSASASEIFSGALQDRKVGTLIGEKTFGKGSVQELINLSNGSAVKITVARWLTPNGRQINKEGISPDIEIKNDASSADLQLNRALEYIANGK